MTNRQWLIWQLIDMSDDEFSKWVNVDCAYLIDGLYCADHCQYNCADGRLAWLKQEHKENSNEL